MPSKYKAYKRNGSNGLTEVQGRPVVVPGYELFRFFAYKLHEYPPFESVKVRGWVICEATTGQAVTDIIMPRKALKYTIGEAGERIRGAKHRFAWYLDREIAKHGQANL